MALAQSTNGYVLKGLYYEPVQTNCPQRSVGAHSTRRPILYYTYEIYQASKDKAYLFVLQHTVGSGYLDKSVLYGAPMPMDEFAEVVEDLESEGYFVSRWDRSPDYPNMTKMRELYARMGHSTQHTGARE